MPKEIPEISMPPVPDAPDAAEIKKDQIKRAGEINGEIKAIQGERVLEDLNVAELKKVLELYEKIKSIAKGEISDRLQGEQGSSGAEGGKLAGSPVEQIRTAKEILGAREVIGPDEIEKAFGIRLEAKDIPKIPFTETELESAQERGQFLILRAHSDDQGQPLSMKALREMMVRRKYPVEPDKDGKAKGKITASDDYGDSEDWWTSDRIELCWALTDKNVPEDSTSKDYHEQTRWLKEQINETYKDQIMPQKYQEAIKEFDDYVEEKFKGKTDKEINQIIGGTGWKKYAEELSQLKLNDLLRKTPAEELYDELAYFQTNGERLNEKKYNWTKRRDSDGGLMDVGGPGADGAYVYRWNPGDRNGDLGVSLSRS